MGIAGLWDRYRDAAGQWQDSYTMLTINADDHPLFKHYHQSGKEKRMVVILPEGAYGNLRAYQLSGDFKRPAGITGSLYDDFMQALRGEPCVIERDQDVQDLTAAPDKLRKCKAPH